LIHFYKRAAPPLAQDGDTHISLAVVFDVPEGQEFKSKFSEMYSLVKKGTEDCLYYGFATCGNRVLCREGYKSLEGVVAHGKEVKEILQGIVGQLGADRIKTLVMAPAAALEALKPKLSQFGAATRFITLDAGALNLKAFPKGCADTHVTVLPEFVVPAGKLDEFKAGFAKAYDTTKNGAGAAGCFYYGMGIEGNSVFCREGYEDAAAVGKHGADVKDMLEDAAKAMKSAGGEVKINVVGPKAQIDALRPKLEPRGAIFWELDAGALWR